jgi:putative flippase GtrA
MDGSERVTKMKNKMSATFCYYVCCGGIATIFDWGSFYIASYTLQLNYITAVLISFIIGSTINYSTNKIFTFNNNYNNISLQFAVFLVGSISALILTFIQMIIFVEYLHIDRMVSRILVTGIMLFYNFEFHKVYTFGKLK